MDISLFDYHLPAGCIAQAPAEPRDAARLLVLRRAAETIEHRHIRDLPALLDPGDLLVVNRSRVLPARLRARRATGGAVEILLLRRLERGYWDAFVRPGRRLRAGHTVHVGDSPVHIETESLPPDARRRLRIDLPAASDEMSWLEAHGEPPLPPYINRRLETADRERYQTVYAREPGSVAAPTAGLHFTRDLLEAMAARGIETTEVVLHVGPGTFRPVQVSDVQDHRVQAEPYSIPAEAADAITRARSRGGRVLCVGTTTVRTLETAALPGGLVQAGPGETDLVVVPGHRFAVMDGLMTNFHLPRSSLLLLVCAFGGRERVLLAYAEAVREGYRFYSYGDAMLIL